MPHYLLIHQIEQFPASQDEWIELWRTIRRRCTQEAEWLHSFMDTQTNKLYCEWKATDLDAIEKCFDEDALRMAPIEYSSEIAYFDTEWLDET
ncbi:MAG: hypothetical protein ACK2T2_01595 [Anaerolineales bacterium]|jgi:hypothetical protein